MTSWFDSSSSFPPYDALDAFGDEVAEKTRKLERLYHQTQSNGWDPRAVLDELESKHGGIRLPTEKREAIAHLFSVLLWGELAAWNVAADLARDLPDLDAKMAATGQVFDEARHFRVLREYLRRAGVALPPMNPYGRRILVRILGTKSLLQKLYGMQLLVENLALAIFRGLVDANVEPVLTELLAYVERDESRHVALGVLYLPTLLSRATPAERARNWAFNVELFVLSIGAGFVLHPHFEVIGLDHRALDTHVMHNHQRVMKQMAQENGLADGQRPRGVYAFSAEQHRALIDFLDPVRPREELSVLHRNALDAMATMARFGSRFLS